MTYLRAGLAAIVAGMVLSSAMPALAKGDRELGQHLSSQCTSCHQLSGRATGGVPPIVGWPEDQFVAVMLSYKEAVRENESMRVIARRLSQEDIEALAAFFTALPAQSTTK